MLRLKNEFYIAYLINKFNHLFFVLNTIFINQSPFICKFRGAGVLSGLTIGIISHSTALVLEPPSIALLTSFFYLRAVHVLLISFIFVIITGFPYFLARTI